ncbi:MAG TPA: glycine zipper domain-containing protein [Gemmatimonas sp.]|uniref:glycine zipper domain-containing protein n=1 Tax=Gemmatimonas sp. TaxID=1962908 RepID=UPI002ED77FC9
MTTHQNQSDRMPSLPSRMRQAALPLLAPVAFGVLTACGGRDKDFDQQLRADLMAAAQAPANRQMYVGPAELGYPQGYAPYPGQYQTPYGYQQASYPQAGYPAPQPQTRVVYVPAPQSTSRSSAGAGTGSSGNGSGSGAGTQAGRRQTEKGAIYGAAAGAAIGVLSSRDKGKGAAVGALGGAVLGGMIGHQVQRP